MVNSTFKALKEEHLLRKLAHDLRHEGCVKGPLVQITLMEMNEDTYVKGSHFAAKAVSEEHIKNTGILYMLMLLLGFII
jgi:hypothetical protein